MTEYVGVYGIGGASSPVPTPSHDQELAAAPLLRRRGSGKTSLAAYRQRTVGTDLLVSAAIGAVLYVLRFGDVFGNRNWLLGVAPVLWVLAVALVGGYRRSHIGTGPEEYRAIVRAALLLACAIALVGFSLEVPLPRAIVLPFVPLAAFGTLGSHYVWRRDLWARRTRGQALLTTVAVGRADSVAAMVKEINGEPASGMRVIAACVSGLDGQPWEAPSTIEGVPIFGPPENALAAVDALHAEVVAVSSHPDLVGKPLRRLAWSLAERDVDLVVAPGIVEVAGPRLSLRPAAGLSLLHVERPIGTGVRVVLKRITDTVMAMVLVLVFAPLLAAIALAVKLGDRGPVFFRQERVGAGSEPFQMYKFRTMVTDADRLVEQLQIENDVDSVMFKNREDPRITKVGKILRKYSLDELPQLFNVLLGDMALVGPRPPLSREVDLYESDAVQRLRVRPGMTGLWQISGRSDLTWEKSLRLDLWYVDNWTPLFDLQIMARTLKAVVKGSGAY